MEKFEQPLIGVHLLQGRDRRMAKGGVGLGDHLLQVGLGNGAASEFRNHMKGYVLIGTPAQVPQFIGGNLRP